MRKKLYQYDIRKWPAPFRDGIVIIHDDLGIVEISTHGPVEITPQMLEVMEKKFGLVCQRINVYPCIPYFRQGHIDIKDEDDLWDFLVTSILFREYQAPPLENGGKSDRQVVSCQRKFEDKK